MRVRLVEHKKRMVAHLAQILQRVQHRRRALAAAAALATSVTAASTATVAAPPSPSFATSSSSPAASLRRLVDSSADAALRRRLCKRAVEQLLHRRERHEPVGDHLRRQILQHRRLCAPEAEGEHLAVQPLQRRFTGGVRRVPGRGAVRRGDWLDVLRVEVAPLPEVARHQKVEEGPQLQRVVLDWRAREEEPVRASKRLCGARHLGAPVLDDVPLVKYKVVPAHRGQGGGVGAQRLVRHDHQRRRRQPRPHRRALGGRPRVLDRLEQLSHVPRRLAPPVRDERGGANNQRGAWLRPLELIVARRGEDAQSLQRLSEPHLVREDAVQPVLPQESQPVHPLLLVRPQLGVDGHGQLERRRLASPQQRRHQRARLAPRGREAWRHAGRVGRVCLERQQRHQRGESGGGLRTHLLRLRGERAHKRRQHQRRVRKQAHPHRLDGRPHR
mmetsp:Transcript_11241/g.36886  ORF Transcript_11241/g.36886 Transcript_11241/m.36886 type:complete len:444 (+) Transcript_11241:254-1585(+)